MAPTTGNHDFGPKGDLLLECVAPAAQCPEQRDLQHAEALFRERYPGATLPAPLKTPRVKWHPRPPLQFVDSWGQSVSGSFGPDYIECNSWGGWVHERIHIHLSRLGVPNRLQHGDGPAKWVNPADQKNEDELKAQLRALP